MAIWRTYARVLAGRKGSTMYWVTIIEQQLIPRWENGGSSHV